MSGPLALLTLTELAPFPGSSARGRRVAMANLQHDLLRNIACQRQREPRSRRPFNAGRNTLLRSFHCRTQAHETTGGSGRTRAFRLSFFRLFNDRQRQFSTATGLESTLTPDRRSRNKSNLVRVGTNDATEQHVSHRMMDSQTRSTNKSKGNLDVRIHSRRTACFGQRITA